MKHRFVMSALAAACWFVAGSAPAAAATIYTDRAAFLNATTGQVVSDFTGLGNVILSNPFSGNDFTLSADSGNFILSTTNVANFDFGTGTVLRVAFGNRAGAFTPGSGVTAFGFDYGVTQDAAGEVVSINGQNYTAIGRPTFNFFGIVDSAGVAPVSFDFVSSAIFDNVTVAAAAAPAVGGIPEPATWAMMIIGMGSVGSTLRRSRRAKVSLA